MSEAEARAQMVSYWMQKADEAIASARREHGAGELTFAINRIYYACFYAASAALLFGKNVCKAHGSAYSREPAFYQDRPNHPGVRRAL